MTRLSRILKQSAIAIVVTTLALFVADYLLLRAKLTWPKLGAGTGTVTIIRPAAEE